MSIEMSHEAQALIRQEYFPSPSLSDLLSGFLKAALKRSRAKGGSIRVPDFSKRNPNESGQHVFVDHFLEATAEDCYDELSPGQEAMNIVQEKPYLEKSRQCSEFHQKLTNPSHPLTRSSPISYQNNVIGNLVTKFQKEQPLDGTHFCDIYARELGLFINRYEVNELVQRHFKKNIMLVGASHAIRKVDHFIEIASQVALPVLLYGEFGTDISQVVCGVHFNSDRASKPLVEVNCRAMNRQNFDREMDKALSQVGDGTLFFNGIDLLERPLQRQLPFFLESMVGQWFGSGDNVSKPRLIASSNQDLSELCDKQRFSRHLLAEFDFLNFELPSIRDRQEDIPYLLEHAMQKYRRRPGQRFSEEAIEVFCNYPWPENSFELERIIARVTALSDKELIDMSCLRTHAPSLAQHHHQFTVCEASPELEEDMSQEEGLSMLAVAVHDEDFEGLKTFHNGIQRALRFLSKSFLEDISLTQLAEEAFVSASHLSFLFKTEVGVPFKTFLAALRVERAKRLIDSSPEAKITDIALDSGFGDLSHFEKTFKKVVGCSPKQYRQTNKTSP